MASKEYTIPIKVQDIICDMVNDYNKKILSQKTAARCIANPKGKFIYLMYIYPNDKIKRVGRLTYNSELKNMEFAIFKYRTETYVTNKSFRGDEYLNGTIEGALKAVLKAYPI